MDACKIKRTVKIPYTVSRVFASLWVFYLFQSHFYRLFLNNDWPVDLNYFGNYFKITLNKIIYKMTLLPLPRGLGRDK